MAMRCAHTWQNATVVYWLLTLCHNRYKLHVVTCREQPWVRFQRMSVPDAWPDGRFDLTVLSEFLLFPSAKDVAAVAERCRVRLLPAGSGLLVRRRGQCNDSCTGDETADLFIDSSSPWPERRAHHENYDRMDLLGPP
jgi:hypothetical protein